MLVLCIDYLLLVAFFVFCSCSKLIVTLRYGDLVSVLPTRVRVQVWSMHQSKKNLSPTILSRKENGSRGSQPNPTRLSYAENALKTMSLPEGISFSFYSSNLYPISFLMQKVRKALKLKL